MQTQSNHSWFNLSVNLMNKLTYPKKFTLISIMFIVVLTFPMYQFVTTVLKDIEFSQKEEIGIEYNMALNNVLYNLLSQNDDAVSKNMESLEALSNKYNSTLSLQEQWPNTKTALAKKPESMEQRLSTADAAIGLLTYVGDKSNLILDPDLDTYYLMDSVVLRLAQIEKNILDLQEYTNSLPLGTPLTLEQTLKLAGLKNALSDKAGTVKSNLDVSYRETASPDALKATLSKHTDPFFNAMDAYAKVFETVITNQQVTAAERNQINTMTGDALAKTNTVFIEQSKALENLIEVRVNKKPVPLIIAAVVTVMMLLIISYLLMGFYLSVKDAVQSLAETSKQLASGDLTARMELATKDELNMLGVSINRMAKDFAKLIGGIRDDVNTIASASEELSLTSEQMKISADSLNQASAVASSLTGEIDFDMKTVAAAIEESSSNLKEVFHTSDKIYQNNTVVEKVVDQLSENMNFVAAASEDMNASVNTVAAAIEEMNASLNEVARNASQASQVSIDAQQKAQISLQTVDSLSQAAKQIENVVDVIKSIASQTNLLALNATIEAASAGEAGKGFAVVANEVKELAKQSAEATEDIRNQIQAVQMNTSSAIEAIHGITAVIGEISHINGTIASAVEEQTATMTEISRSVTKTAHTANNLTTNVQDSAQKMSEVALKIKESIVGIKQITENLNQLSQGTNEVASSASKSASNTSGMANQIDQLQSTSSLTTQCAVEVQQTSQELAKLAADLEHLVSNFKL